MGGGCISYLPNLEELNLLKLKKIDDYCLINLKNLTKLDLPHLEEIGEGCFEYCPNLVEIDLSSMPIETARTILMNLKQQQIKEINDNEEANHRRD